MRWFSRCRQHAGGLYEGLRPTNFEYGTAVYLALREAGYTMNEAMHLSGIARAERLLNGLADKDFVPRVPGRMPQRR